MTALHRDRHRDPVDGLDSYQVGPGETAVGERARARLQCALAGASVNERRHLLDLLGLDNPAEILAQLAHRHQQGAQT